MISYAGQEKAHRGSRYPDVRIEVVLLDIAGETLVKIVSGSQAARAASWTIGDTVETDGRGRFAGHRPARDEQEQSGPDRDDDRQTDDRGR
jgi:hypothetical protein